MAKLDSLSGHAEDGFAGGYVSQNNAARPYKGPSTNMGVGQHRRMGTEKHPFFQDIDWEKLMKR